MERCEVPAVAWRNRLSWSLPHESGRSSQIDPLCAKSLVPIGVGYVWTRWKWSLKNLKETDADKFSGLLGASALVSVLKTLPILRILRAIGMATGIPIVLFFGIVLAK